MKIERHVEIHALESLLGSFASSLPAYRIQIPSRSSRQGGTPFAWHPWIHAACRGSSNARSTASIGRWEDRPISIATWSPFMINIFFPASSWVLDTPGTTSQTKRPKHQPHVLMLTGNKPATLFLWRDLPDDEMPKRLEALTGREDGTTVYGPKPLACSPSAVEAGCFNRRRHFSCIVRIQ